MPLTELIGQNTANNIDITILNLLRCEPPSLKFNFFEYGGLTRSVFRLLQDVGNLEDILSVNSGKTLEFPSSADAGTKNHRLMYEKRDGIFFILANAHNNFSSQSDAKFFGRTEIIGTDGKKYDASLLALEVYREKGDMHPIWSLGFYITEKGDKKIIYGENIIVSIPKGDKRLKLEGNIEKFILSMKKQRYDSNLKDIKSNPQELNYLKKIIANMEDIEVIDKEDFNINRAKWFRYLAGTLDVKNMLKFEDRYAHKGGLRVYRVELISTHLTLGPRGEYIIEIFGDTEGSSKDPHEKIVKEGPYRHSEAWRRFLEIGNLYLNTIYLNAEKGRRQFDIALKPENIYFKYATIIKDKADKPITISSWETSNGRHSHLNAPHHYLQIWNNSPQPLRLDEGTNFDLHPRKFMGKLLGMIPKIGYKDGTFIEEAIKYGVPLRNPKS